MSDDSGGLIKELRDITGRRQDVIEQEAGALRGRLHAIEITLAELRGAQSGLARLTPWLALALSAGALVKSLF